METYLVTGGAGFVGSNIAISLKKQNTNIRVVALDNLKRRGSELNLQKLREHGVEFLHGDIRCLEDLELTDIHTLIECSAEPSVLAGYGGSPAYLLNTNLVGTINCLELARRCGSKVVFLSTSRVYPVAALNALNYTEAATRFEWSDEQEQIGASSEGVTEAFTLQGARSLYGTTKLSSELIIQEYVDMYGIEAIINRCGLLAGPGQMGKTDQGVISLWVAKHIYQKSLSYIGYGGEGKQVRDVLHIDDLFRLLQIQLRNISEWSGQVFNVGGGLSGSVSLQELTDLCQQVTGKVIPVASVEENRPADLRVYLTDHSQVTEVTGWKPTLSPRDVVEQIAHWIHQDYERLEPILA